MSDILGNPTLTGLLGGGAVIVGQFLWNRVTGASDEKSIPVQLAEIKTTLAQIETTLQIMKNDAKHAFRDHEELKADFWSHMDRFHTGHGGNGGGQSGAHRSFSGEKR